jgi:hypothetical protein
MSSEEDGERRPESRRRALVQVIGEAIVGFQSQPVERHPGEAHVEEVDRRVVPGRLEMLVPPDRVELGSVSTTACA